MHAGGRAHVKERAAYCSHPCKVAEMRGGLHANEVLPEHETCRLIESGPQFDATAPLSGSKRRKRNEISNVVVLLEAPFVLEPGRMHKVVQCTVDSHSCCFNCVKYLMVPATGRPVFQYFVV